VIIYYTRRNNDELDCYEFLLILMYCRYLYLNWIFVSYYTENVLLFMIDDGSRIFYLLMSYCIEVILISDTYCILMFFAL